MKIYLAIRHPEHPFVRGSHTEAGTVEKVFSDRKIAMDFVDEKNRRATYNFWSVLGKKVDGA